MISDQPELTLPHRAPFLWVSRLIERTNDGTFGVAELDLPANLEIFKGHFPGQPVFPGVLQIEAAGQAAIWIANGPLKKGETLPQVMFAGLEAFKFKRPVIPPATLRIQAKQVKAKASLQYWSIENFVNGELCSSGAFWVKIVR